MNLDDLDRALLDLLRGDARLSFRELARRTGSTTPTVAARVRGLEAAGVIRGYRAEVAPPEEAAAYVVTARTRPADTARVAEALAQAPGVTEALALEGGVVVLRAVTDAAGMDALLARLGADDALLGFESARVLDARAPEADDQGPTAAVRCHACGGPVRGPGVHRTLGGRRHVLCCRHCAATMEARYERLVRDSL